MDWKLQTDHCLSKKLAKNNLNALDALSPLLGGGHFLQSSLHSSHPSSGFINSTNVLFNYIYTETFPAKFSRSGVVNGV